MSDKIDIETLKEYLPFYVNGSIEPDDKATLEEALTNSAELRSALEQEKQLQARFNAAMHSELEHNDARRSAPQMQVVDGEETPVTDQPLGNADEREGGSLGSALAFLNPKNWAPAVTFAIAAVAAGQTAVVLAQSGTISDQQAQIASLEEENFALASGQKDCIEAASIVLELNPDVRWSDAAALIDGENLALVGGAGQGVLLLGFDGEEAELDAILARLNASALVLNASKAA